MRILFAFCLSLFSCNLAHAACARPGAAPAVPDGTTADDHTMVAAHDEIQKYVNSLEAYQVCLKKQAETATSEIPEEQKTTWLAQGDAALDTAESLAMSFSAALKSFKERSAKPK
jgi:hypothetical protein